MMVRRRQRREFIRRGHHQAHNQDGGFPSPLSAAEWTEHHGYVCWEGELGRQVVLDSGRSRSSLLQAASETCVLGNGWKIFRELKQMPAERPTQPRSIGTFGGLCFAFRSAGIYRSAADRPSRLARGWGGGGGRAGQWVLTLMLTHDWIFADMGSLSAAVVPKMDTHSLSGAKHRRQQTCRFILITSSSILDPVLLFEASFQEQNTFHFCLHAAH